MCAPRGTVSQYAGVLLSFVRLQALAPGSFSLHCETAYAG